MGSLKLFQNYIPPPIWKEICASLTQKLGSELKRSLSWNGVIIQSLLLQSHRGLKMTSSNTEKTFCSWLISGAAPGSESRSLDHWIYCVVGPNCSAPCHLWNLSGDSRKHILWGSVLTLAFSSSRTSSPGALKCTGENTVGCSHLESHSEILYQQSHQGSCNLVICSSGKCPPCSHEFLCL